MSADEATTFCASWLPSWTGNDPERLLNFYTEDAFYSDPAVPSGLTGVAAIRPYFEKLLGAFPEWIWTHERSLPVEDGFLNYWSARLNAAVDAPRWEGICIVRLRGRLIFRNEVFFDRSPILTHLKVGGR